MSNGRIPQLGYRTKLDLRTKFPISRRYALRKTVGWVSLFIFTALIVQALHLYSGFLGERFQIAHFFGNFALAGVVAILAAKYIHAELYRRSFYYGLDGFRLVISRGIVVPQVGSLPLLPVSEIYIHRDLGDVLCNVCNIDLYTPMDDTRRFARIEGLAPRKAVELQNFLGELLNVQIFLSPEAKGEYDYLKALGKPVPGAPSAQRKADGRDDKESRMPAP